MTENNSRDNVERLQIRGGGLSHTPSSRFSVGSPPLLPHAEGETSQITFTKSGAPKCNKCGHYLRGDEHPGKNGLFWSTVWCICDCYEKFDRDGKPKSNDDPLFKLYVIEKRLGLRI